MMRSHSVRLILTLTFFVSLGGCQGTESEAGESDATPAEAASVAIPIAEVVVGPESFEAPAELPAGYVTVRLTNNTDARHAAHLIRVDEGHTPEELLAAYGEAVRTTSPRPDWMAHRGGPIAERGTGELTLMLEPGRYMWVCVMGPDDAPHFLTHEAQALTVTGTIDEPVTLPPPDAVVRMVEHGFEFSTPLRSGPQSLEITNAGAKDHLTAIMRLNPGSTAKDALAWFQTFDGPPPATGVAATSALAPGQSARLNMELEPGVYLVACFANADGTPHVARGGFQAITVD